jgi:hypothetical protein
MPAGAHHSTVISEAKTAAWSETMSKSTGARTGAGVGVGAGGSVTLGASDGRTVGRAVAVGDGTGGSVTVTVGRVGRSGGGSRNRSIRASKPSNRSPAPSTLVHTAPTPNAARSRATIAMTRHRPRRRPRVRGNDLKAEPGPNWVVESGRRDRTGWNSFKGSYVSSGLPDLRGPARVRRLRARTCCANPARSVAARTAASAETGTDNPAYRRTSTPGGGGSR